MPLHLPHHHQQQQQYAPPPGPPPDSVDDFPRHQAQPLIHPGTVDIGPEDFLPDPDYRDPASHPKLVDVGPEDFVRDWDDVYLSKPTPPQAKPAPEDGENFGFEMPEPHVYAPPPGLPPSEEQLGLVSDQGAQAPINHAATHGAHAANKQHANNRPDFASISRMASINYNNTDPAFFEQAAQGLEEHHQPPVHNQHDNQGKPHHDHPHRKESYTLEDGRKAQEAYRKAYEETSAPTRPDGPSHMDSEIIGSAAAVEALRLSAAQHRPTAPAPAPAPAHPHPPTTHTNVNPPSAPTNKPIPAAPAPAEVASGAQANTAPPSSPEDKLIALAMAQAAKLFDHKAGGSPVAGSAASAAKMQAIQSAAKTAMRMVAQYKSSGKASFEPGEMQTLIQAAMALL